MGVVYKLTNTVNGKVYVGKTWLSIGRRLTQHRINARRNVQSYLYRAMRKHGKENFVAEILDVASTEEGLSAKETEWIIKLRSGQSEFGYNCTFGGDGQRHTESSKSRRTGWHHTDEAKAKISASQLGKKHTKEHRERWRKANVGRKQSPEGVARRAESNRRFWSVHPEKRAEQARQSRVRYIDSPRKFWEGKTHADRVATGRRSREWWASPAAESAKKALANRIHLLLRAKTEKSTPEQRQRIARNAAAVRWAQHKQREAT